MKFVLFISVLLASCMVVEGAKSSDTGPNRNIKSISGIREGQGGCTCGENNPRSYCCRSYCDGKKYNKVIITGLKSPNLLCRCLSFLYQ